ncbi:MAG: hypothetical protein ACXV8J_06150 [Methylobacter sp.]
MKHPSLLFTMGSSLLIFAAAFSSGVSALTISPTQGQTPEQIQRDQADCTAIAQQSAGSQTQPAAPSTGGRMKGAAKGAAAGAAKAEAKGKQHGAYENIDEDIKQEYRQNEAKSNAKAGAAAGGANQRQQRRESSQQSATSSQSFDQAYSSCLMGRGYSVQ